MNLVGGSWVSFIIIKPIHLFNKLMHLFYFLILKRKATTEIKKKPRSWSRKHSRKGKAGD